MARGGSSTTRFVVSRFLFPAVRLPVRRSSPSHQFVPRASTDRRFHSFSNLCLLTPTDAAPSRAISTQQTVTATHTRAGGAGAADGGGRIHKEGVQTPSEIWSARLRWSASVSKTSLSRHVLHLYNYIR